MKMNGQNAAACAMLQEKIEKCKSKTNITVLSKLSRKNLSRATSETFLRQIKIFNVKQPLQRTSTL
jgi:hypothetical protein